MQSPDEEADYDAKKKAAEEEIRAIYVPDMEAETERLTDEIVAAKETRDSERVKALRKELREYEKRMEAKIKAESRALLKERFVYPVFLYEAEKVGITATGEPDQNELYPNDSVPPNVEKTCLELYQEFREEPSRFFVTSPGA